MTARFVAAIDPMGERTWMELLFLSFTTLSSTGLSDVVPVDAFLHNRPERIPDAVRANLEVSLRLARLVDEFPLPDETEPASVFAA